LGLSLLFSFLILYTVGRTRCAEDKLIAMPSTQQDNPNRINAHTDIHVLSGTRNQDTSSRAGEGSSCLRPRGHCNRQYLCIVSSNKCSYCSKFVRFAVLTCKNCIIENLYVYRISAASQSSHINFCWLILRRCQWL
jgi:hypothetical protein